MYMNFPMSKLRGLLLFILRLLFPPFLLFLLDPLTLTFLTILERLVCI